MRVDKQKLQIAMATACMNMEDLSDAAKISAVSLRKYSSGRCEPRPKTLGMMAKALNVSVEDLIQMEGGD